MAMLYCTFTVGNHANWRRSRLATRPRLRALDARGAVHLASARSLVNILEHNRPLRPHKTVKALWNKSNVKIDSEKFASRTTHEGFS
ncbi:hypothetical protein OH76DRAFT_1400171, partial [Lentinus brumalis]